MFFVLSVFETEKERMIFAEFYEEHMGLCMSIAISITRSHVLAEEAVQETFMKFMRHKEKYFDDLCKRTPAQIVIMVKSAAIDILRREKRLEHDALNDYNEPSAQDEPDAYRITASKEAVNRLQHFVSQMDETSQAIYEMKFMMEMTDGEIAEQLGISKNAAAVRIHRLRMNLKEQMRGEGFIDG